MFFSRYRGFVSREYNPKPVLRYSDKNRVFEILPKRKGWIGVVDRDEWTEDVIAEKLKEYDNLWVLPRFCIDNYLIIPEELWSAFPPKQRDKVAGGQATLTSRITSDLDRWVAHGVLWSVANPLWEGLRSLGFKDDLLNPEIALNEQKIKETLANWHNFLEPDQIWEKFQKKHNTVSQLDIENKLRRWVHGKKFYEGVVNHVLNDLLGQKVTSERKISIFRHSPV
ncbi:MAG: hypothetical protein U9P37_09335, partial [Pseudomonadota bacterium]|nr:hypothetical protein [Pseudomonadota bacterium]